MRPDGRKPVGGPLRLLRGRDPRRGVGGADRLALLGGLRQPPGVKGPSQPLHGKVLVSLMLVVNFFAYVI